MVKSRWPAVLYKEEALRDGMQIEDAAIPVEEKVRLLDALSDTGLKWIAVGSFVSPRYTPQMARIDEIVQRFTPRPGVKYTALALNEAGVERARQYVPPLTLEMDPHPRLVCHMCDVFARRNTNRSMRQEVEQWPQVVARAQERGITEAGMGLGAAWGSNFLGDFPVEWTVAMLERQHRLWDEAGIKVISVAFADPMSWCHPWKVEQTLAQIKERWPEVRHFRLHLHNGRNMAVPSAYAALRVLGPGDTLELDGTIGGFGGCPYCGNGQTTGMAPTEDLLHMLEDMGVPTGVDMDRLVECAWMAESILGRRLYGHVSRAGPRPKRVAQLYDINMPFVETEEQARHFKLGPSTYKGGIYPWREPIGSPFRERVERGLPAFEPEGDWPWSTENFPIRS
ncbi:MAG: citramalate synthase [Chloroflexi bacterium]|nr:citramalate synthase [Chloroflexota bacterium]